MKGFIDRRSGALLHPGDNIAVSTSDFEKGAKIRIEERIIVLRDPIEFGHKFAIQDIPADEMIIKYGEIIGVASKDITTGEHVHIHNVRSLRGRAHG